MATAEEKAARRRAAVQRQAVTASDIEPLWKRFSRVAIIVGAVGVLVLGIWSLRDVLRGTPVAAAFTRVGGETAVETAVDASRFWLTPPRLVVETSVNASQGIMLGAAQCAMVHDAPLLFTSPNPKRQRLVDATINSWRKNATTRGQASPEVIRNLSDVTRCVATGDPDYASRLSKLEVPNQKPQPSQLPRLPPRRGVPPVPAGHTLAPVVVFAAALAPWYPPDVAVGFALAAHLATAGQKVSLVVVPRYLEADHALEDQLGNRHEPVTGGVVLGQTPTVPEDTRVLLRQLLTSPDRLAQVQANLTTVGPVVLGLLALLGLGTAVRGVGEIGGLAGQVAERTQLAERTQRSRERLGSTMAGVSRTVREAIRRNPPQPSPAGAAWLTALGDNRQVTVWLRSGWKVAGTVADRANVPAATVWRLDGARLTREGDEPVEPEFVLVSVGDIEMITKSKPDPAVSDS